jgi:HEAT repeat protein
MSMLRSARRLALIALAACGLGGSAAATPATPTLVLPYIDHIAIYTLGFVVNQSTHIAVLRVDKVSREKKVIVFKKAADLKGRFPQEDCKVQVTDGFRSHEPHLFLGWADPGRIAIAFSDGATTQLCLGTLWYEVVTRPEAPTWWTMTHLQSNLSYAYHGSVPRLAQAVSQMIAGKEAVISVVRYGGDSASQRRQLFKNIFRGTDEVIVRQKASLKMPSYAYDYNPSLMVGPGAGGPENLPPLLEELKNAESRVRRDAAEELGRIGGEARRAIPQLEQVLRDPCAEVRIAAAGALANIDPSKADASIQIAIEALKEKTDTARRAAAWLLGDLGKKASPACPALSAMLGDPDGELRWAAANSLGEIGPASVVAIPGLLGLLVDKEANLRAAAADALGQIGGEARGLAQAPLARALKDSNLGARQSAARALLELGTQNPDAVHLLSEGKANYWEYANTLAFLVRTGGPAAGPCIAEGVKHPNHEVRMAASNLLMQVPAEHYRPALAILIEGLKDGHYFVRARCARAILNLAPEAKSAVPGLLQLIKDNMHDDWEGRAYAAVALGKMGVREKTMLSALIEGLEQQPYKDLRLLAARFMGEMGVEAKAAVPALVAAAKESDAELSRAAGEVLKKVAPDEAAKAGIR